MYFLLKMVIFHCYVSLPEGSLRFFLRVYIIMSKFELAILSGHGVLLFAWILMAAGFLTNMPMPMPVICLPRQEGIGKNMKT